MKLIIDTNLYSGNFEREMCAYITGQIGECGVGEEHIDETAPFYDWWSINVVNRPDEEEYPCYRPCAIEPTPGMFNNGLGGHFPDTPQGEADASTHYTDAAKKQNEKYNHKILEVWKRRKWPCYQSVAIFSAVDIPDDVFNDAVKRAHEFAKEYGKGLEIGCISVVDE